MEDEIKTEFNVRVVRVEKVEKHPNADTLDIIDVEGYPVISKTGNFKAGDLAVYVPVDAIVPTSRPEFDFLKKEGKDTHRIKAVRLRGIFSMGLLVPIPPLYQGETRSRSVGDDVAELLGVTKFIPVSERNLEQRSSNAPQGQPRKYPVKMPIYGLDPFRKYGNAIQDGEEVVVTEKLHGCNARYVVHKGRLWVGSHRAMRGCSRHRFMEFLEQLKLRVFDLFGRKHRASLLRDAGDVWWEIAEAYELKERLEQLPNMVLYGEIYGEHVQDLVYDSPRGRKFRAFDVYDLEEKRFLDAVEFEAFLVAIGLDDLTDRVPVIYEGEWSQEVRNKLVSSANGARSVLNGDHVMEGFVVKPVVERSDPRTGRVALKYVGEGYLLRDESQRPDGPGGKSSSYKKAKEAGFPKGDRVIRPELERP